MFAKLYSLGIDDDTVVNVLKQDKFGLRHLISEHQQLCWILKEAPNLFPFRRMTAILPSPTVVWRLGQSSLR
jgi:hypothetical protein